MDPRDRYLFVCLNRRPDHVPKGSCAARGSEAILARLRELLRERGLAATAARACSSSCLGLCEHGPVVAVEPDHCFYGAVTVDDLEEIVDAATRGDRVERLVVGRAAPAPPASPERP